MAHVDPEIKAMMTPVYKKYNFQLPISSIAEAAGTAVENLPRLPELVDKKGRNQLCYNHVLGKCMHGSRCKFCMNKGHVHGNRLPPQFVRDLCGVLRSGVDWCVKNDVQLRNQSRKRKASDH